MKKLAIKVFTDPACPYAYSAEPSRWRLRWLYGDQLQWRETMIVLSGYQEETSARTPEQIAKNFTSLREQYGMPINDRPRPRLATSVEACRAYVAARRHEPAKAELLLRRLRVAAMGGELLDAPAVIEKAVADAGLDVETWRGWTTEPATEQELMKDAEAARRPSDVARGFRRKLSETSTGRLRYSAPSYQFMDGTTILFELPGFWPLEAYEAAIGNLAPELTRADDPQSVVEVLRWAGVPLATKEVAVICNKGLDAVRAELEKAADFTPLGQDGFWKFG